MIPVTPVPVEVVWVSNNLTSTPPEFQILIGIILGIILGMVVILFMALIYDYAQKRVIRISLFHPDKFKVMQDDYQRHLMDDNP